MTKNWQYIIGILILINITIYFAIFSIDNSLRIITCNVGQGDAILINKGSSQILIDGGPNNSVINCLSRHMPFWDNQIDLVIMTHPEADHYTGLIDVFKQYQVKNFLASSLNSGNQSFEVLKDLVQNEGSSILSVNLNSDIQLGLIYLDIVWPNPQNLPQNTNQNIKFNNYSIVFTMKYQDFSILFTGDIEPDISGKIIDNVLLSNVNVIKIPHHGSKNGLSEELLKTVKPEIALISVGKNQWGHPHQEIIILLNNYHVKTLRTDELGDIIITTDGITYSSNY